MSTLSEFDPEAEPGAQAGADAAPGRRSRRVLVLCGALAVVIVAAAVLLGVYASRLSARSSVSDAQGAALAAARTAAVDLTTYDYRHLDRDFQRVRAVSTKGFAAEFDKEAAALQQLIGQTKAVAAGRVVDGAVVDGTTSSATVLVAVDDTVTNTQAPKGVVRHYRMQLTMSHQHGSWLVSGVQSVA